MGDTFIKQTLLFVLYMYALMHKFTFLCISDCSERHFPFVRLAVFYSMSLVFLQSGKFYTKTTINAEGTLRQQKQVFLELEREEYLAVGKTLQIVRGYLKVCHHPWHLRIRQKKTVQSSPQRQLPQQGLWRLSHPWHHTETVNKIEVGMYTT